VATHPLFLEQDSHNSTREEIVLLIDRINLGCDTHLLARTYEKHKTRSKLALISVSSE